jgi:D-alanine-D-alanine ligase
MGKRTVALIAGGWSREREVSLQSGAFVYESLDKDKYEVRQYDPKSDLAMVIRDSKEIDIAFVILHGKKGEDGCFQGLLDLLDVPYVGSGVLASSLAMNKQVSKELYRSAGLTVPRDIVLARGQEHDPVKILSSLGQPVVIKPVAEGSSIGLNICSTSEEVDAALDENFSMSTQVLAEEYIKGTEVSCGVIGNSKPEALPVIEIVPQKEHRFFTYEAKYVPGECKEICPATLSDEVCKKIQAYALKAHSVLGCKGLSRSDMIVTGKDVYLLETNTLPGMTKNSLFPLAVRAAGLTIPQFLDRLIELALDE